MFRASHISLLALAGLCAVTVKASNTSSIPNGFFAFGTAKASELHSIGGKIGILRTSKTLNSGHTISIKKSDLTQEDSTAIVNAANGLLKHGGGLAGAISRAGGSTIQRQSDNIVNEKGALLDGQVAVTSAGSLPSKWIIHAVGPVWKGGKNDEEKKLYSAVTKSLEQARDLRCESISIPAISSGIFGFPKDKCASIILSAVVAFCENNKNQPPTDIRLANFDDETVNIFESEFKKRFGSRL